jgi:hypothetical protein
MDSKIKPVRLRLPTIPFIMFIRGEPEGRLFAGVQEVILTTFFEPHSPVD